MFRGRRSSEGSPLLPLDEDEPTFYDSTFNLFGNLATDSQGVESLGDVLSIFERDQPKGTEEDINSNSIDTDIPILREIGFVIDYPDGKLGEGRSYGVVYSGHYENPPPGFPVSNFAVKIMDFGDKSDPQTIERREWFETEKYVLTNVNHPNVVSTRMIINMGDVLSFRFSDMPDQRFLSPSRIYMFMDFADGGDLKNWLDQFQDKVSPSLRYTLIRDLFFGMLYLHSKNISHGDIHSGNALIFVEKGAVVAKWSDFGIAGVDTQYRYRPPKALNNSEAMDMDIFALYEVLSTILTQGRDPSSRPESPEEQMIMDEITKLVNRMRGRFSLVPKTLRSIYEEFKYILGDEPVPEDLTFSDSNA